MHGTLNDERSDAGDVINSGHVGKDVRGNRNVSEALAGLPVVAPAATVSGQLRDHKKW